MRLTVPWFGGLGERAARAAASACALAVLVAAFAAWPAPVAGQDDGEDDAPSGVYSVTIGRADLPQGLAGGPALIGQWTLTLKDDGTYEVARQDVGVVASGAYEVTGATLNFADWAGIVCGGGEEAEDGGGASYAWETAGDELRLTPIQETCGERRILLATRPLGSFAACTTQPLRFDADAPGGSGPAGTPVSDPSFDPNNPVGPPAAATPAAAAAEGAPAGDEVAAALETLLAEATACWGTGDPARFLPLHGQEVISVLLAPLPGSPPDAFLEQLRSLMAAPVSFELIGDVTQPDPATASAYVEITFDGAPIPQRLDFVRENGAWLFAFPFFLGPLDQAPTPAP